jgi:hypothetical protein
MPPAGAILAAVVAAGSVAATGTAIFGLSVAASAALAFAGSLVISTAQSLLSPSLPKPKSAVASAFESRATGITRTLRQPITAWRTIYGEMRVSGPITFLEVSEDNEFLHIVVTLAGHPCEAIGTVFLDDDPIYDADLDGDGEVTGGAGLKYSGHVRVKKDLGTTGQPFADLVTESDDKWTSDHKQAGRTKLYLRFKHHRSLFPSGLPNVSAVVRGKKLYDPRSSTTEWSPNPALVLRDYLTDTDTGLGVSVSAIDDAQINAAANICDEFVASKADPKHEHTVLSVDAAADEITLDGEVLRFQRGDKVEIATTGSAPGGLTVGTSYYLIPVQEREFIAGGNDQDRSVVIKIANSYANALAGTAIDITSAGTGTHTLKKTGEPRYTANGAVETSRKPSDVIPELLSAMGGDLARIGATWAVVAAGYRTPTVPLDESDLRGPRHATTKVPRRERFNAVKGIYVSPLNFGEPSDYPPVTNAAYLTEDNGERMWREMDLPFTSRPQTAQRLAKIALERMRQEITEFAPCNLAAFQVQALDTLQYSNARMGWTNKVFDVVELSFAVERDSAGAPLLGIDLKLRETASAVYDWNSGEETVVDPAPNTTLPDVWHPAPPTGLGVTETLYSTRDGAGVKARAALAWMASADQYVQQGGEYEVEYKITTDSAWTFAGKSTATDFDINDIAPGAYDFRVRAINTVGAASDWALLTKQIAGLLAPPTEPQGLTISVAGGMAIPRWDRSPDLDVRIGGKIVFRHDPAMTGAAWATSVSIGEAVAGSETVAVLPLKSGTYLAKAVDSSGIESTSAASVTTKGASVLTFANLSTLNEHTGGFTGTHSNTVDDAGVLKLLGTGMIDDVADIDALSDVDGAGGIAASGTYTFAAGIDLGSVKKVKLSSKIVAVIENTNDIFDDRVGNIDDWVDFDGIGVAAADAQVWARETDDDPAASPTWSAWQRLDSAEFEARAFEFQERLATNDPAYNIRVSESTITAEEVV